MAGDFNTCLRDIDRSPPTHLKDPSRKLLKNLIVKFNITDIWDFKHSNKKGFTFLDKRNDTRSRLDYIFVSKSLVSQNCDCNIIPSFNTKQIDHDLVVAKLSLKA